MTATDRQELALATSLAETELIGCLLFAPEKARAVGQMVRPADFADRSLRTCFEAIARHADGADGDGEKLVASILPDLRNDSRIDDARALILNVRDAAVGGAHAEVNAQQVRDLAIKRRIRDACELATEQSCSGHAPSEILADLGAFLADEQQGAGRDGVRKFTLRDLKAAFPERKPPVVDGLFREGNTVNLIAAPKIGKSWTAYSLAASVATGTRWLDHFETRRGDVLLIDNELDPEELVYRVPYVAERLELDEDEVDDAVNVWPLRGNLRTLDDLAEEPELSEPGRYKLIVLDAKYRFAAEGVSENDNAAETQLYNKIDAIAKRTGAAICLIHHANKGNQSNRDVTDVGAGAGAQSRAVDCHLVLRPHEEPDCVVLDAALRSFPKLDPVALRWRFPVLTVDWSLDPSKLRGLERPQRDRQQEEDEQKTELIMRRLTHGPHSIPELVGSTGLTRVQIDRLIGKLAADKAVDVQQRDGRTKEYSLAGDADDHTQNRSE